ncbi:uncharacterized protein EV422DRAFT_182302 [Fimicolochytrium jonesii]|uniref:uncharacterized protein n=1 Tax=Fimicolochytrium jonesii TaxID=1396493 RepID=UPI0022FF0929|nr:uncharacterized protein EV422DRAFT_182302 [Fimicolochytrium jonesii]KAI8818349.1 hypothetical protein EV422DRAFT_182302 [Fimicolochytrium jonesii]
MVLRNSRVLWAGVQLPRRSPCSAFFAPRPCAVIRTICTTFPLLEQQNPTQTDAGDIPLVREQQTTSQPDAVEKELSREQQTPILPDAVESPLLRERQTANQHHAVENPFSATTPDSVADRFGRRPRSNFTLEQDKKLLKLVAAQQELMKEKEEDKKRRTIDWQAIAIHFPGRKRSDLNQRYTQIVPGLVTGYWSPREDQVLLEELAKKLDSPFARAARRLNRFIGSVSGRFARRWRAELVERLEQLGKTDPRAVSTEVFRNMAFRKIAGEIAQELRNEKRTWLRKVPKSEWTPEEDQKLISYHDQMGPQWSLFTSEFPGRTKWQISYHFYHRLNKNFGKPGSLTKEEMQLVQSGVKKYSATGKKWVKIAETMVDRTPKQLAEQWALHNPELRKGKWSRAEERTLKAAMREYGDKSRLIHRQYFPHRATEAVRLRIRQFLAHNIENPNPWTTEADKRLLDLVQNEGVGYEKLRKAFPKRNPHECELRYDLLAGKVRKRKYVTERDRLRKRRSTAPVEETKPEKEGAKETVVAV